jgi:protein TonB
MKNQTKIIPHFTLTDAPRALYMPGIPYPRVAKNAKIEGIAEISYTIDDKGRVISVEILSIPHISFENVIKRAVLSWRFSPATQNGKPVSIKATKTIVFKLTD